MSRITILDAVVAVLADARAPQSSREIHDRIVARSLFSFNARDPIGIVRAAIRKHLRTHGGAGQPTARLRQVERDRFAVSKTT